MRVLITGITGMVGSHLADYILYDGQLQTAGSSEGLSGARQTCLDTPVEIA